jgi:S-DNA-T family DNA segregation ATPase FtsK/SpoIIIE
MKPIRTASTPTFIRPLNLLLGALLLLVATLLLLALATWHVGDPSLDTAAPVLAGHPLIHNWIGPSGAWISDLLLQIFGLAAFALPLWMGGLALRWLRSVPGGAPWLRWAGVVLTLLALPTALGLIPYHWRWLHILPIEGAVGRVLADALIGWLSLRGAAIVAITFAFAGLYFSSEFTFRSAWEFLQQQSIHLAARMDRWRNWRLDRADRKADLLAERQQIRSRDVLHAKPLDSAEDSSGDPTPGWTQSRAPSTGWLQRLGFGRLFARRQREESLDEVPAVRRIGDLAARRESAPKTAPRSIWERPTPAVTATSPATPVEPLPPVDLGPQTDVVVPITQRADGSAEPTPHPVSPAAAIQPIAPRPTPTAAPVPTAPAATSAAPIHERADADLRTTTVAPKNVSGFKLPPSTLLLKGEIPLAIRENELRDEARKLVEKCAEFRVNGQIVQINPGPMVTTFEFKPDASVKYSRVAGLGDDLCLAMRAESILIERMAGKSTIGIQVPNHERETIHLRDVIESETFTKAKSRLTLAMGKDINGRIVTADLASMPHVLIAGSTGSGKSVAINAMIMSLLFRTTPAQVRLILVDPKRVELGMYEGIPHLFTPIITEAKLAANIDELADLMMLDRANVEESITRLAQMARAVGIHLVLATQRPSVDVITGLIKANVPTRISFRLASKVDSRTIIDDNGAESLLGRGDMLFRPPGTSRLMRLHAPYVSENETAAVVDFWKAQGEAEYVEGFLEAPRDEHAKPEGADDSEEDNDPLFDDAVRLVFEFGKASTSLLQRRLRIGYGRAAHLIDLMERDGLVGPADGSRPRELLKSPGWLHEVPTAID